MERDLKKLLDEKAHVLGSYLVWLNVKFGHAIMKGDRFDCLFHKMIFGTIYIIVEENDQRAPSPQHGRGKAGGAKASIDQNDIGMSEKGRSQMSLG
ncbi:hypothetical protein ACFSUK_15130 [Sphingobium scionense]